jgi:hypothetical protein
MLAIGLITAFGGLSLLLSKGKTTEWRKAVRNQTQARASDLCSSMSIRGLNQTKRQEPD